MKKIVFAIPFMLLVLLSGCSTVVEVQAIKLDIYSITLSPEDVTPITATVYPANATYDQVVWSSTNKDVVIAAGGWIKAINPGVAIIQASAGGVKSDPCVVLVERVP